MKSAFTAAVWQEDDLFVAQCLEVDLASQGKTEDEAVQNLQEALELHFQPPQATWKTRLVRVEAEIRAS